jgi:hypothetical protein
MAELRCDPEDPERAAAILQQANDGARSAERPSDEIWTKWIDRLAELLAPLEWTGWELPEAYDTDFDHASLPAMLS